MNDPLAEWFADALSRTRAAPRSTLLTKKAAVLGLLLTAAVGAFVLTPRSSHANIRLVASADELTATAVEAALDTPLDPTKNTIWCASAPLAWKALKEVVGGDVEIENAPPWVGALNRSPVESSDVDPAALVTGVGWIGEGVVEEIQDRVRRTFGKERDPWLDDFADGLEGNTLLAYAYLARAPSSWRNSFV